jgi:preprotein translocase subunit SecE|tara:strand:+ start:503 stop:802 length:300 start_codon:yes stop_codon:yes gene_type:complete
MSLNREQKRALKKRGELGEDGSPVASKRQPPSRQQTQERVGFRRYVGEVRAELRKVAWPTRAEVINYSIVVFITLVILTTLIALADWGLGEALLKMFER